MAKKRANKSNGSGTSAPVQKENSRRKNKKSAETKKIGVLTRLWNWLISDHGRMDLLFFTIIFVLLVYGMIMMFSASYVEGLLSSKPDGFKYVKTQGLAAIIGIAVMLIISFLDYHIFMNSNLVILGYFGALSLLTFTSFFGKAEHGARRWLEVAGQSVQPSEIMKPVLIVFMAFLAVKNAPHINDFKKGFVPFMIALAPVCVNMVLQRHISGLLIMAAIGMFTILLSEMSIKNIAKISGVLVVVGVVAMLGYSVLKGGGLSYIFERFASMKDIEEGVLNNDTWQGVQSLIAMGSGGWFGLGFGESRQKYLWLPESQNDFIISIIVEELGYIGGLTVVILFALFIYRGFKIASKAPDKFGTLIAGGITFQIGLQAILNIGVACNAIPNTGVSLPFFSSGGSALAIQLAEMGVILSVSRKCRDI